MYRVLANENKTLRDLRKILGGVLFLWWITLLGTGLTGAFGFPSSRLAIGLGDDIVQWLVSGALIVISLVGLAARGLKLIRLEAIAAFGIVVFTILHSTLYLGFEPLSMKSGIQTGLRIFAASWSSLFVAVILWIAALLTTPTPEDPSDA